MAGGIRAPQYVLDELGGLLPRLKEDPEFFKNIIGKLYNGLDDEEEEEVESTKATDFLPKGVFTQMFGKAFGSSTGTDD